MAKLLVFSNAHALAHVSRPLEVARILRNRGDELVFAGLGKYLAVAADEGFRTVSLPYVTADRVVEAVRSGRLDRLYPWRDILGFVEAERALIEEERPDLVLIDNRPSAAISAEASGIGSVAILNVHMSQSKAIPFNPLPLPDALRSRFPFRQAELLENLLEAFFLDRLVMKDLGRLRKKLGLKRRFGFAFEEGDFNLFADLPEFNPVRRLPDNARYVGPLTWHNDLPPPPALERLGDKGRCLYFTIGSEGLGELIEQMRHFIDGDRLVIVATGSEDIGLGADLPDNLALETFVNADRVLPHCDLIVCHGGNGTIYQALGHGVPIVGVAMHEEQFFGLKRVRALGVGLGFRIGELRKKGFGLLAAAIREVLENPRYRENARKFQALIRDNGDSAEKAANLIQGCLERSFPTKH